MNGEFGTPEYQPTNATDLTTTTPMDRWKRIETEFSLTHTTDDIHSLIFRFWVNEAERVPTVWYIDNIKVYEPEINEPIIPGWDLSLPSLAERYADYFVVGNILEPGQISSNPLTVIDMFLLQYNSVTAENVMKVDA
jgi:hypothetical protein